MKRYAISSASFDSLEKAKKQIEIYSKSGMLDVNAAIYESSTVYYPIVEKKIRYTKATRVKWKT